MKGFCFLTAVIIFSAAPARAERIAEGLWGDAGYRTVSQSEEQTLLGLLADRDAGVRAQAARALRGFVIRDREVQEQLVRMAWDGREQDLVRREAVKTLAWAGQERFPADSLGRLALDARSPRSLRALALRALFIAARDVRSRDLLTGVLVGPADEELRLAAAWGLMGACKDFRVERVLLETALAPGESPELRVEALKSLSGALEPGRGLEGSVRQLAGDGGAPLPVREAALLSLAAVSRDLKVQRFLLAVIADEAEDMLRGAAARALGGADSALARWLHWPLWNGQYLDPLEGV